VQLVGADALAEAEKGDLAVGRMLREDFLQQSGLSDDAFCPPLKTYWMLKVILTFYEAMVAALRQAVPLERALPPELLAQIARMRDWSLTAAADSARQLIEQIETKFREMV
jgi:V/A-type H+-transporting ATPase subunit A